MYLDTFSRRARSLATILIFARVRILGTQCLFVIATVTKVSRKRGLWLVVRVNKKTAHVLLPCRQSEFCVLSVIYYVTVQYPHTYRNLPRSFPSDAWQVTSKNPFQIGFADGIFAFRPMFYYGQRSKCADLLNSYFITF